MAVNDVQRPAPAGVASLKDDPFRHLIAQRGQQAEFRQMCQSGRHAGLDRTAGRGEGQIEIDEAGREELGLPQYGLAELP
jgi:hypothetical protein